MIDDGIAGPSPEELGTLADGARMAGFLPYFEREVDKMVTALERRVFKAIDEGTLTPEAAMYAWMERQTYYMLLRRFRTTVRLGVAAGERVAPDMYLT